MVPGFSFDDIIKKHAVIKKPIPKVTPLSLNPSKRSLNNTPAIAAGIVAIMSHNVSF